MWLLAAISCAAGCGAAPRPGAGVSVWVGGEAVRGYRPRPALVTEKHRPTAAKFPAIDVHCHWDLDVDPAAMIRAMDERGIAMAVNLSGDQGSKLDRMLEKFYRFAPDRFVIFCSPDLSRIDDPDFASATARFIEGAVVRGAGGVKIYKSLGLSLRDRSGRIVPVDDPRLNAIWATAGRLGVPVLIHTADPMAFFTPVDRFNERWMQLKRHPGWRYHGSDAPGREALLAARNRVIERHPNTQFIGAHVGNSAEDLGALAAVMRRFANFHVDISGRVAELGRQPYSARRFIMAFQDRVLFGTDRYPGRPQQPRYRIYFRFLETWDEYFDYYDHPFPPTGEWKIYGIGLPDDVLRKVYQANARRIFAMRADRQ